MDLTQILIWSTITSGVIAIILLVVAIREWVRNRRLEREVHDLHDEVVKSGE